jgi:hypothetical protein
MADTATRYASEFDAFVVSRRWSDLVALGRACRASASAQSRTINRVVLSVQCKDLEGHLDPQIVADDYMKTVGLYRHLRNALHVCVIATNSVSTDTMEDFKGVGDGKEMPMLVLATRKELEGLGSEIVGKWISRELDAATRAKIAEEVPAV